MEYYKRTKIFPIMHTVVIRRDVHEKNAFLASALYHAFEKSRRLALEKMKYRGTLRYMLPWMTAELDDINAVFGGDPWPYGVEANRPTLSALVLYLEEQGVIAKAPRVDDLFVPLRKSWRRRIRIGPGAGGGTGRHGGALWSAYMKLASYVAGGKEYYGAVVGDGVVTLNGHGSLRNALAAGALDEMRKASAGSKPDHRLADIRFLPVIPNPHKIHCAGVNYKSHAAEVGRELPKQPSMFIRFTDTLVGHEGEMIRPKLSDNFDFEVS